MSFLLKYHTLNLLLNNQHSKKAKPHCFSLSNLTSKQQMKIKSSVVDSNNCLNRLFPLFDNLHQELSFGFHLVDNFSDYYSFYLVNYKIKKSRMLIFEILTKSLKTHSQYQSCKNWTIFCFPFSIFFFTFFLFSFLFYLESEFNKMP